MMTMHPFNLEPVHPSWLPSIQNGLSAMDANYLASLANTPNWLPGPEKIFNAFSLPINKVNYVLFGESPYPRAISANGYAFWDAAVKELWSPSGLSKPVNRATSMRNILKMLLIAEGLLSPQDSSQTAITQIDKNQLIQTNKDFFTQLLNKGFLLLNATPILQANGKPQKDAKAWLPFVREILATILEQQPQVELILLGRIANTIDTLLPKKDVRKLYAEHPYNLSFITNSQVIDFFKPLHLLHKYENQP